MKLEQLKDRSVLVLGLGREGQDTFLFLRRIFPEKKIALADQLKFVKLPKNFQRILRKAKKIQLHLGKNYLKSLKKYEVIIKSPGIPPKILAPYLKNGQIITSQTEIFFENCPGKIIGIAGTKGKSTTASLVYQILKEGRIKAHLVGNIGRPVLSLLLNAKPNDIYIYELSSYQLLNLKKSPPIAIFLNTYPDHLDYHKNYNEYLKANANITRYQTKKDFLIYNSQDKLLREIAKKSKAQKIPIPRSYEFVTNRRIPLISRFNLQNIMAAVTVGRIFGISDEDIAKAIKEFKSLPHRLEFVGQFKGIKFYNDSLSVIPETTIAAMEALGRDVQTIILGGFERQLDYKKLAQKVVKSQIKTVILFPTTGERIWKEIEKIGSKKLPRHFFVNNMKEAVKLAYQFTEKGKVCLLSPASASFGLFKDYQERGNQFKKWVKLFHKMRALKN